MRVKALASLIGQLINDGNLACTTPRLLLVGQDSKYLSTLLPDWKVFTLDEKGEDRQKRIGRDGRLNFSDVEVVACIGVLEHLTGKERDTLMQELLNSARCFFIDLPTANCRQAYGSVMQVAASEQLSRCFDFGLPTGEEVRKSIKEAGFSTYSFVHTSLPTWLSYSVLNGLNEMAASLIAPEMEKYDDHNWQPVPQLDKRANGNKAAQDSFTYELIYARRENTRVEIRA